MTSIFHVPPEVYAKEMVPYLPALDTRNFSLTGKVPYQIVQKAVRYPQEDITLEGKRVMISLVKSADGTIAALLRQKVKMEIIFTLPPSLANNLKEIIEYERWYGNNPEDLSNLIRRADSAFTLYERLGAFTLSIVPFDFNTKKIEATGKLGLGNALIYAIGESNPLYAMWYDKSSKLVPVILSNPSAVLVRAVLSHPNAVNIPAKYDGFDLKKALILAVKANNPEIVRMILAHPNAPKIPFELDGLARVLEEATRLNHQEIVELIAGFFKIGIKKTEAPKPDSQADEAAIGERTDEPPYGSREQLHAVLNSGNPEVAEALAELLQAQLQLNDAEPVHAEVRNGEPQVDVDLSDSDGEEDAPALRHALNNVQNAHQNND